jgi:predicted AlkP superfamily phosphohydrolase/phosphomutase
MTREVKRVILVGLDGMQLCQVKQFAGEGCLPNFKKLLSSGSCGELFPEWPAWTPTNWGVIATGALPGTTMLSGWLRRNDDDLEGRWDVSTFSSRACPVETIWEAAERAGLRTLTIFHPLSWPPVVKRGMVVAPLYSGPGIKPLGISRGRVWTSQASGSGRRGDAISARRDGGRYVANAVISPSQTGVAREFNFGDKPDLAGEEVIPGKPVDLSLSFDPSAQKVDIELADGTALATAARGQWTPWLQLDFGERGTGNVRFYLYACDPDGEGFILMHSAIYPTTGYTYPADLAAELTDKCGPFLEAAVAPAGVDPELDMVWMDEQRYQGLWMARVARHLLETRGWDLYYQHFHVLDGASHRFLAGADPASSIYDPGTAPRYVDMIRKSYEVADAVLGEFMNMADGETVMMALSDHGNVPNRFVCDYDRRLEETGLLVRDGGRIVWEKSKAFRLPQRIFDIFINLKGRYPKGIVDLGDYETVQNEIIDALLDWRNPAGERVVAFALKKRDAQMVGYWGKEAGDVFFVFNAGHGRSGLPEGTSVAVARGGANHGPQISTTRTGFSSNLAAMVVGGPGIKKGYERDHETVGLWRLVDIVPTVSHLLGFDPPADSRGAVMYDILE